MPYKLIHDPSYAEQKSGYNYVVLKVLDEDDTEVAQVKLEFVPQIEDEVSTPTLKLKTHGTIAFDTDCFPA